MEWQDDQYNTILWCPGNMGMGKTVLASNIVAKFHANRNVSQVISYYFCVSADPKSLSAMSILGSLAVQILDSQIANAEGENLESLHAATCVSLDTYELTAFIAERLEIGKTYYLIIDGLDQCEASEIRYVVQSVAKLCGTPNRHVKVLYTGRPDLETEISREMIPVYKVTLREGKVQSEMNHYIDTTLHLYLQDKRLKVGAPGLVIEIYDTLRRESHGM